ncbi:hypothetical protein [Nocardia pseudovaccinii]|uniref:hypothetical protein n=1 Tax=Nocardia pseudovaccinii TaxID=189540 RepID=UPI0035A21D1D
MIDLSTTLPGGQATMFLADAGTEVIFVEPLREAASGHCRGGPLSAAEKGASLAICTRTTASKWLRTAGPTRLFQQPRSTTKDTRAGT